MSHRYYQDEIEQGNNQRLEYFDDQFISLAKDLASNQGITLKQFLSGLKNFTSFKAFLEVVFSSDPSLASYVSGMKDKDKKSFFNRNIIQDIVDSNTQNLLNIIDSIEFDSPDLVVQEKGKTIEYFDAQIIDKKTGRVRKVLAIKDSVTIKGKKREVFRDSKGRFVKKI